MTRLKTSSRAASAQGDVRVTEIINGLIVSKPARKLNPFLNLHKRLANRNTSTGLETYTYTPTSSNGKQQESKAASVPGIINSPAVDFTSSIIINSEDWLQAEAIINREWKKTGTFVLFASILKFCQPIYDHRHLRKLQRKAGITPNTNS